MWLQNNKENTQNKTADVVDEDLSIVLEKITAMIKKQYGIEVSLLDVKDISYKKAVLSITTQMINFLMKNNWILVYIDNNCSIFIKVLCKKVNGIRIPLNFENTTLDELASIFSELYELEKDQFTRIQLAKEIFGEEKTNDVISHLKGGMNLD